MAHEEEVEDVNIRLRQDEELDFFTELALHETERWIQAVTRKKFQYPDDFRKSLENGVLLCELVNCLKPGSVKRINKLPTPIAGLDNINVFQKACRENFSLSNAHLFDVCDLEDLTQRAISESEDILKQEQDRRARNVAITVYWIARSVSNSNNNNVPQLDFSAFSALVHQKELTPDPVESRHDSWDSADLSSAYSSHESTSRGLQGDGITARHVRDSSYDSFGSLSNSRDSELSFTEDSHRDNQHNNEDNMPMSRDFSNSMSNLSRHHGFSTVGDNNDMYRSTPDLQNSHTRTSSTDSYEGSHHNHSRQSSDSGTVEIPTRVLSGARKTSTSVDPFAFVNISKQNQLAQIAKEQIKISEETKSIRKPSENELGDWQSRRDDDDWKSNFTDWKNKRRRRSEATLHRVEESERLGQEMEDQKKTKTFSEMMEEKKSRRKSTPILSYPIDDDDELFVSAPHVTETMKRVLPIAEEPVSRRPAPKLNLANKSKSTGVLPVSSLNTQKEEKHAPWLEDKKTTKSSPKGDNSSDNKENSVKNHNSVRDQNGVQSNKDSKNSNKISAKVLSRFSTDSPVTNTSSAKNSSAHQGVPTGKISNIRSNFESKEKEAHVDYRQPKQSFNFRAETRQKHPHHSPTSSWSAVEKVESRAPRTEITKHTKPVPTEAFVDKIIKISQKPNNAKGFGFTFTGGAQNPCKITKISLGSGADLNDLLVGDTIMSINRKDVTSSIMTTSLIQKTIDDANRLGQIELHVRRVICEKDEDVFSDEFEDEEEETSKSPVSLPSALAPKKPSPTSHKPSQPPPVSSKPERSRLSRDETTPTRSAGNIDKSPIIVTAEHVIPAVTPLQRLAEFHARQDEDIKLIPRKETNNNEIGTSGSQKEAVDLPKEREMSPGPNEPVVIERVSIQHSELPVKSTTTELSAPSKETKPYSRNLISEEQKREITEDVLVPSSTEKVNSVPPPYQEIMMERPTISHSREVEHLSKAPESQTYKTESVIDVYSKPSVEILSNARDSPPQVQYSPPPPLPPEEPEDENGGPPAILKRWQKRTSRPTSSASSLDSTNDRSSTSSIPLWENSYSANNTSDLSPLVNEPFPAAKVGQEVTVEIPMINQPQLEQLVIDPRNQVSPGSSSLPQYNFHVNIGSKGLSADEAIEQERQRVQEETERRLDQEKLQSEEQRKVEEEEERKKEEMKKKEEELRKMEELLRLQSERLQKEKEEFERQKNQRNMEPKTTQPVFNVRQNFSPHDSDNGASRKVDKWNPPVEPLATRSKTTLTREDMLAMNRKATPLQRKPEVDPNEMKGSDSAPASREAPSRQEIHSLNAVPKPRYRSSQDWISDSGVNSHVSHKPESHSQHHGDASVHSHWMVEEAERRRKADSDRMSPKHFSSHGHRPKNEAALSNRWREDNVIPKQQFQSHSPSSLPRNLTTPGGHPHTYPHHHPQPHHQANHSSPAALHPQSHSINSSLSPHREPHRPSRGSSSSSSSLPSPSSPLNSSGDLMAVSGKQGCSHCHQELGFGAAMVIESLGLYYHVQCFKCCVCRTALGNGSQGADVRVRGNKLHCRNCYSNDEGTRGGRSSS